MSLLVAVIIITVIELSTIFAHRDLLAEMHMCIDIVAETSEKLIEERDNSVFTDCDYMSDDETYITESKDLTRCVRRQFTSALRALIEHGVSEVRAP